MAWKGYTSFNQLSIGTSLHLVASPTIVGHRPHPIAVDSEIIIEYATAGFQKTKVLRADPDELVLQDPAGKSWKLTPQSQNDFPVDISSPGLNTQDWVVRSAA